MSRLTDEQLIRQVLEADVSAYGQLVKRYEKLVFGIAFHMLGNVEDARDVCQNVFIRAFTRLAQVRDALQIGAWLRAITVNECRAWASRGRATEPLREAYHSVDEAKKAEDRLLISSALNTVDEASRLTVILFYLHAYSMKEIGSFLDEPVTTIKSRLRNARGKLRKEMESILERKLGQDALPGDFAERVTRMIEAAKTGDGETIRALLEQDPDLLSARETPGNHTPLHIAAASGDAAVIELLLVHGADPNAKDASDNACPIHYAAERGWLDCVKLLVEAGADIHWNQDVHERGPLGWAVVFNPIQTHVAEYLMEKGAELDLFSATALGRLDEVKRIVESDPKVLEQRTAGCDGSLTPIEYATGKGRLEIARYLAEHSGNVTLSEAAGLDDVETVGRLIAATPSQEELDRAVSRSVKAGQIETTRLLLKAGANPDFAPDGTSLIFDAMAAVNEEMARLLLSLGADLDFRDDHWKSNALGWEVFFGRPNGVRLGLKLGSAVDSHLIELAQAGERGELRRHSAGTPEGYRQVVELLQAHLG